MYIKSSLASTFYRLFHKALQATFSVKRSYFYFAQPCSPRTQALQAITTDACQCLKCNHGLDHRSSLSCQMMYFLDKLTVLSMFHDWGGWWRIQREEGKRKFLLNIPHQCQYSQCLTITYGIRKVLCNYFKILLPSHFSSSKIKHPPQKYFIHPLTLH